MVKILCVSVSLWLILLTACSELEKPKTEPFYAETAPPQKKEFRWSNGKMPKSFDPATAAAAPETDVVRAVFEGLTDTNPKTLEAVPSVAEKWTASEDFKTWTFYLRKDAKWSNGANVTAQDFVRSWKRLADLGDKVSHPKLLENIVGMKILKEETLPTVQKDANANLLKPVTEQNLPILNANTNLAQKSETRTPPASEKPLLTDEKPKPEVKFGVEALNDLTLKVSLAEADKDFPVLIAHPLFRPIYGDGKDFETGKLNAAIVTNGAFRIASIGQDGITLDRAEYFWGKASVELERVRFVPTDSAEKALEAYRAGEIDAVTNASFEPLALKLLEPYEDFRRTTHSALNFYEFNRRKKPFDDRRVREALAIAIERERLTEIEMDGSTRPALNFLPFDEQNAKKIVQDKERAKELLAEAGFENGEDFPVINLVVNRNDTQQRIAKAVVKMWKQTLDVDAVITVKDAAELETARATGAFDVLRRGVVLPTADETAGLTAIFAPPLSNETSAANPPANLQTAENLPNSESNGETQIKELSELNPAIETLESQPITTESQAIAELPAIPLYFPTSHSLVKPYIQGFEINTLDAPSLKDVKIDNNWQPKKANGES